MPCAVVTVVAGSPSASTRRTLPPAGTTTVVDWSPDPVTVVVRSDGEGGAGACTTGT
ncbi:hypothetical protein GCM10025868_36280 [Angustibacter aerolatus]|uniref:Uncharacterized protein n=1 Tax=Angustibacter aerolatus TaxID=1162965 RepID=A0ABQ6JJJ9_9ACTN|nr:hypothetical protein GCM10025868_36280 [Angustibacter aerolatus]